MILCQKITEMYVFEIRIVKFPLECTVSSIMYIHVIVSVMLEY